MKDILSTAHGNIELPVFMPVGTKASVKSIPPRVLKELDVKIILANTYHLYLKPGSEVIKSLGGVHKFMSWDGPILTDSGGFQVFSLTNLRKINDDGVTFKSHIDGSTHIMTPELAMQIQEDLGSDIRMVFDECHNERDDKYILESLKRTTKWAKRSKEEWQRLGSKDLLFGIIQGGMKKEFRKRSFEELLEIGFDGYAIGGLSVGEEKNEMYEIIDYVMNDLKPPSPVYLMGVGDPLDILFSVKNNIKMFDCVIPTRNARNGGLFTFDGKISIKQSKYIKDGSALEESCDCYTCKNFSRAYLRHLYISKELLSYHLNTIHNLRFFMRFMQKIRDSIKNNTFDTFYADFLDKYNKNS